MADRFGYNGRVATGNPNEEEIESESKSEGAPADDAVITYVHAHFKHFTDTGTSPVTFMEDEESGPRVLAAATPGCTPVIPGVMYRCVQPRP